VRKGLAALVALSLFSLQAQSLAFHVHVVQDNDRDDDHRHAPAIHHHADFDNTRHIDEADPTADSLTLTVPVATPFSVERSLADSSAALLVPQPQRSDRTRAVDMRSHGPPVQRASSLRGPPTSLPV